VFKNVNEWFNANLLMLHFDKTSYMQFITKNSSLIDSSVGCNNKQISNFPNVKFLGIWYRQYPFWESNVDMIGSCRLVCCQSD
jgi:hypothetical protein